MSVERAIEQAEAGRGGQTGDVRWDARDELRLLVTHGALHVCGWDHAEPDEEAAMRALERRLLGSLRSPEPWAMRFVTALAARRAPGRGTMAASPVGPSSRGRSPCSQEVGAAS